MSLTSELLKEGFRLPITRRGLFSQDDFFRGFQKDYSRAVSDVLDRWGSRASKADRFASYRRLRERDASEDSQAATISETPDMYTIVIDMSEYASGELTVQTVGLSAVVEGKVGQKTYKRSFPLPKDTVTDGVVADLSDESILTITAPRKGKAGASGGGSAGSDSRSASSSTLASLDEQIIPTKLQTSSSTEDRVIPTVIEGAKSSATHSVKTEEYTSSAGRRGSSSRIIPLNVEGEATTTQTVASEGEAAVKSEAATTCERVIPTVLDKGTSSFSTSYATSGRDRVLPIKRRGKFFQDSTFERVWGDFESAIDELMSRRGSRSGAEGDRFQSYRNLRQCVQQEDSQAATVSKENGEYKIVVDVKDFVDGHLDVKAQEGAIIVTGRKGPCSFERRFSISGLAQPDKVAASLSADGVLTITAPK